LQNQTRSLKKASYERDPRICLTKEYNYESKI
jgi:hypothetical protein